MPGGGVNTVDFSSGNFGNDARSSDDIFAARDEQITTLEDNIFLRVIWIKIPVLLLR
ncbi:hypothetical protein Tco_0301685, partial [Tanacetum coccineum]